jgi:hypothetical protein
MKGVPGVMAFESQDFLFFSSSESSLPMAVHILHVRTMLGEKIDNTHIPTEQWIPDELAPFPLPPGKHGSDVNVVDSFWRVERHHLRNIRNTT